MKTSKKIIALILAALAAFALLAACGNGEGGGEEGGASVKGETQSWGNLTVLVPEGYALTGGSLLDADDPDSLQVYLESSPLHAFTVSVVGNKDDAVASVDTTKEINAVNGGAGDVSVTAGGVTWNGYAYKYGSVDCFVLYGEVGGKWVLVSGGYHAYDSEEAVAVLGSITVK
ncbi:MAG: hypothetical protein IKZ81_06385 [Clostridia bacterium]|nr:hypothetical protein [Clostridia bacterium]